LCRKTNIAPKNQNFQPPAVALPTYAAIIGSSLYIGCNGGKIFALHLSNGRVFASAYPVYVDDYDQIVSLGHNALAIGGKASGAFMFHQSAIVKSDTLSAIAVFRPDRRIIGARDGSALVEDTCCWASHSDSWPANIAFVSLSSGELASNVRLHPYQTALPRDRDLPGAGVLLAVGNSLYVGTRSALFVYDLKHLDARPRVLYADLVDRPMIIDGRYLSIQRGAPGRARSVAVLDTQGGIRVIASDTVSAEPTTYSTGSTRQELLISHGRVRRVTVDASCMLSASSETYAFMVCRNVMIASHAHLGAPAKAVTFGPNTLLPQSIAVYSI
jgi:hypothetical protein